MNHGQKGDQGTPAGGYRPLRLKRPVATVVVDVEEEFDWSKPFSSQNQSVDSLEWLNLGHCLLSGLGFKPTYLVTYPIACSPRAPGLLRELAEDGCDIGAQLHPWVTPPFEEDISTFNSFPSNLPMDLERRKIECLIEAIDKAVGVHPSVYKAGRYGLELSRARQLADLGFRIDTSVMPYSNQMDMGGGPNFFGLPDQPFWLDDDRRLLGLPSTQGVVGLLSDILPVGVLRHVFSQGMTKVHLPGILSRLGMLERLRLSPEGSAFDACKRLIDTYVARGDTCFVLSFHSPSLQPGCTPYVANQDQLNALLENLYLTLRYLVDTVGAVPVTATEIFEELSAP